MSPKIGAMTIQVFQDQVDGLARVFGPPALGALPAQRSLEALERRADLVELLRRGSFLLRPGLRLVEKNPTANNLHQLRAALQGLKASLRMKHPERGRATDTGEPVDMLLEHLNR